MQKEKEIKMHSQFCQFSLPVTAILTQIYYVLQMKFFTGLHFLPLSI